MRWLLFIMCYFTRQPPVPHRLILGRAFRVLQELNRIDHPLENQSHEPGTNQIIHSAAQEFGIRC